MVLRRLKTTEKIIQSRTNSFSRLGRNLETNEQDESGLLCCFNSKIIRKPTACRFKPLWKYSDDNTFSNRCRKRQLVGYLMGRQSMSDSNHASPRMVDKAHIKWAHLEPTLLYTFFFEKYFKNTVICVWIWTYIYNVIFTDTLIRKLTKCKA